MTIGATYEYTFHTGRTVRFVVHRFDNAFCGLYTVRYEDGTRHMFGKNSKMHLGSVEVAK
jgi:hypothetical protein